MLLTGNLNDTLAVIITCHRYEQYLREALQSVLTQNALPKEIIVVDDKPLQTPSKCEQILSDYPSVKYLRTDHGDPLKARQAGFKATSSKYVCFLDADDRLGRRYLAAGLDILATTNAAIVYSDIQYFGNEDRSTSFDSNTPPSRIYISNFMHVGCLVTREAIQVSDAFNHPPLQDYQEDWMFWRKIVSTGYEIRKQSQKYYARMHTHNRSGQLLRTVGYYELRGIAAATITFASFYRQRELLITKQSWPLDQIHLSLYGNSTIAPIYCNHSINSRQDRINHAARTADTDYIFYYNEYNNYPQDICEQLLRHMSPEVAAVHDSRYNLFDCTMVVAPIMRENPSDGTRLSFKRGEKLIRINEN